ncbi:MAG: hypothetical protein DRQ43_10570 [Gammaproteobacteria bacterium]|nr:MAG: hypothetical protein DRQ43_10570 [Gammaproteobacteria bacterium]
MSVVKTNKEFVKTLASLSLAEQRYLGAQFIFSVLDIIDEPRLKNIMNSINKKGNSAEELHSAYKLAHSFYIETHPHSGFEELDFKRQAIHMVAEACVNCLAPIYQEVTTLHLAQKTAMYCRMAITCWNIPHDQEFPSFSQAEIEVKNITQIQYTLVNDYIESRH